MRGPMVAQAVNGAARALWAVMLVACACAPDGSSATSRVEPLVSTRVPPHPPPMTRALSVRLVPEGATSTDAVTEVVVEALVRGGDEALPLSVDFVAPGGTTFQRVTAEVAAGGERALSFSIPVAGTDAARLPGAWSAVLIGPRGPLASAGFELKERAP